MLRVGFLVRVFGVWFYDRGFLVCFCLCSPLSEFLVNLSW